MRGSSKGSKSGRGRAGARSSVLLTVAARLQVLSNGTGRVKSLARIILTLECWQGIQREVRRTQSGMAPSRAQVAGDHAIGMTRKARVGH